MTEGHAFTMFRGDMQHTGAYDVILPRGISYVKWQINAGTILKAPVALCGFVIAASIEHGAKRNYGFLQAFDTATGVLRWVFDGKASMGVSGGITTTPAVSEGLVLFGSGEGQFYAVELASGRPVWEFKTSGGIQSSPTVMGSTVYFGSADSNTYALDVRSGKLQWKYAAGVRIHAPIAIEGKTLYIAGEDGSIHALSFDGELRWRDVLPQTQPISIAVSQGFMLVSNASEGSLSVMALSNRKQVWMFQAGGRTAAIPAVSSGVVCISCGGHIAGLDLASGKKLWMRQSGRDTSAPVIVGSATAVVASRDGKILAVDLVKGTELWMWEAGDNVLSEILIDHGTLYFGGSHGKLVALD